jgi:hypothetical protein
MVGHATYIVRLSSSEREALEGLVHQGKVAAAKRTRAPIRLKADAKAAGPAWTDAHLAEALDGRVATIHRTRPADVTHGVAVALERQRPIGRQFRQWEGAPAARLVAVAWSPPPEGYARWTLRRLADRLVTLERVGAIGQETVRRTRNNMTSSRG